MIKVPNYDVVVPTTPDLVLYMRPRQAQLSTSIARVPNWYVPPAILYYDASDSDSYAGGSTVNDLSGNNNHGTLRVIPSDGLIVVQSSNYNQTINQANSFISFNGSNIPFDFTRGHTVAVFNPYTLILESIDTYDTYALGSVALLNALKLIPDYKIVAIGSFDATSFDQATRTYVNSIFKTTSTQIWPLSRISHIIIGQKNGYMTPYENSSGTSTINSGAILLTTPALPATPPTTGSVKVIRFLAEQNTKLDFYADELTSNIITVEMWAYVESFSGGMLFGWQSHDVWTRDGTLGFNTGTGDVYGISASKVQELNLSKKWHHYVFVMNAGDYTQNEIYINNVKQVLSQQFSVQNTSSANFNNGRGRIGGWYSSDGYQQAMDVNLFKVYNSGLTELEIYSSYNKTFSRFVTGNKSFPDVGDREHDTYEITVTDATVVTLPWLPMAQDWVEIYLDEIRIVNPRIKSATGGSLFEVFNVKNNVITFNKPVSGALKIICDAKSTHYWGSLILNARNVQGFYVYTKVHDFEILKWNVTTGTVNGLTFNVFYEPGPEFQPNSYVLIENCVPTVFNGNFKVIQSTPESVTFRGETTLEILENDPNPLTANRVWYNTTSKLYKQSKLDSNTGTIIVKTYTTKGALAAEVNLVESVPSRSYMIKPGSISGFGNATVKKLQGISLFSEPIIITQPRHGYARLTTDRQSIAYVPNVNYKGFDTFSWSMINQHGQIGTPKCVQINVRDF